MANPTRKFLEAVFDYNPETGEFINKVQRNSRSLIGRVAGVIDPLGYRRITIDGKYYLAHRLAWLFMTGEMPPSFIDHINCNRSDNRWTNLRLASRSQNLANSRSQPSKTGVKGVSKVGNRYRAQGFHKHLGYFDTPSDAHAAYMSEARKLHGEFARSA